METENVNHASFLCRRFFAVIQKENKVLLGAYLIGQLKEAIQERRKRKGRSAECLHNPISEHIKIEQFNQNSDNPNIGN